MSAEQHRHGAVGWLGALQAVMLSREPMACPSPHTAFKPFPSGSLKEPLRRAGTLSSLNTKRQLRGSGEDTSLITKTPSH